MAEIHPFRAYRYDTNRVALKDVLTQPYDKITPAMQEKYYAASPYNLITIEKGRTFPDDTPENNVYTRAAAKGGRMDRGEDPGTGRRSGHLRLLAGISRSRNPHAPRRIGFIALGRVEDYDAKVVFRHERTLSAPKADRIELLRNASANGPAIPAVRRSGREN